MKQISIFKWTPKQRAMRLIALCSVWLFMFGAGTQAQSLPVITSPECNTPLVGKGAVINRMASGLVEVLNATNNVGNIVDADMRTYTDFGGVLGVNLGTGLVSVRDINHTYAAGVRAGFTIKMGGESLVGGLLGDDGLIDIGLVSGLLDALTDNYSIRTYLDGVPQEISNSFNLIPLSASSLGLQQLSFVTTMPFDEIELVQTGLLSSSLVSSLEIYYAYVEKAEGCDSNNCMELLVNGIGSEYGDFSIDTDLTDEAGLFTAGVGVSDEENVLDSDTSITNYATVFQGGLLVEVPVSLGMRIGEGKSIPKGSLVGFAIQTEGLLDLGLLSSGIVFHTYKGEEEVQEAQANNPSLLGLSIGGGKYLISFVATEEFDRFSITFQGGIGVSIGYTKVFYPFVYEDIDADGIFDCIDNCINTDKDEDGILDECDTSCSLNAGLDVSLCAEETEYDFASLGLGSGFTWRIISQSEGGIATIDSNGKISGMTASGEYIVEVSDGTCADTVRILRRDALTNSSCNTPIVGNTVEVFDPSNGGCLLCLFNGTDGNVQNIIDGDLSNFIQPTGLLSLLETDPLIGVRNSAQVYPAGTRTGFVVGEQDGSLLSLGLLGGLEVITYLNGVEQESSGTGLSVLETNVINGSGSKQRVGFVTSKPFDAVVLQQNGVLDVTLFNGLTIYYAFQEPAEGCDGEGDSGYILSADCSQTLLANNEHKASIAYEHTSVNAGVGVATSINDIGALIDSNPENETTINMPVGVLSSVSVAVKTAQTIDPGEGAYQAGFVVSIEDTPLLNLTALAGLTITVHLANGGTVSHVVNDGLVDLNLLDGGESGKAYLSFPVTEPFNVIELTATSGLASALTSYKVYNALVTKDSDGDGTADCMDKCCLGEDYIVGDDGLPMACSLGVSYNASCVSCPVSVNLGEGGGVSPDKIYSLYLGDEKVGDFSDSQLTFTADTVGHVTYTLKADNQYVTNIAMNIHPNAATWKKDAQDNVWKNGNNWESEGVARSYYPIWCTDVTITDSAQVYPELLVGDSCRDITLENGATIGKPQVLHYRHAYVEFIPERNRWMMVSAPLKYMYSADYGPDTSWINAEKPAISVRYFNMDYVAGLANPDNISGAVDGNFSHPFADLDSKLDPGFGFTVKVNGSPSDIGSNFPVGTPYRFPRRDSLENDVVYQYYLAGLGIFLPQIPVIIERGNDIKTEGEWTVATVPDQDNRYRFIYEGNLDGEGVFHMGIPTTDARTIILGNPFMSHLDFQQFYNDNTASIQNYFRIWNGEMFYSYMPNGGSFINTVLNDPSEPETTLDDSEAYIAPMQSFFVDSKAGATSVSYTPAASVANAEVSFRAAIAPDNVLKLKLEAGTQASQTLVVLHPEASFEYKAEEDVSKLFSPLNVSEIYTLAGKKAIDINVVDADEESLLIPIGIRLPDSITQVKLSLNDAENFAAEKNVYIIDQQENKTYNARTELPLTIDRAAGEKLNNRFFVSISESALRQANFSGEEEESEQLEGIKVSTGNGMIIVQAAEGIDALALYDTAGKLLYQQTGSGKVEENIPYTEQGAFVLKVETAGKTKSIKIIL